MTGRLLELFLISFGLTHSWILSVVVRVCWGRIDGVEIWKDLLWGCMSLKGTSFRESSFSFLLFDFLWL